MTVSVNWRGKKNKQNLNEQSFQCIRSGSDNLQWIELDF